MSKTVENRYSEPKISPRNPSKKDLGKDWYVWFDFYEGSKWRRVKKRGGINYYPNLKDRLREAKALKSELQDLLENGWNPLLPLEEQFPKKEENPYEGKFFVELLEEFYILKKSELRGTSHRNYQIAKNYLISWLRSVGDENIMPEKFTPKMANAFLDSLTLRGISNTTWNNYKEATQFLLNMFTRRKIIEVNPFKEIKNKRPNPKKNRPFTARELKEIWNYLKINDIYLYRFSLLMYYCYIRPVEITRIQVKEVLLEQNKFYIPGNKSKNRKDGYPRIPERLKKELSKMDISNYPGDYYIFGSRSMSRKNGVSIQYKQENRQVLTDNFREVFKKLGITDRNLYSFKHTGVIAAYNAGVKIKAIQMQLRHHSLEETDIYLRGLGLGVNDEYLRVDY